MPIPIQPPTSEELERRAKLRELRKAQFDSSTATIRYIRHLDDRLRVIEQQLGIQSPPKRRLFPGPGDDEFTG